MEYKEFRPWHYSGMALDENKMPWLKKLSKKKRAQLREAFAQSIGWACEGYIKTMVDNLPIKRELNAPITEKDLQALVAELKRELERMKGWSHGAKPLPFDKKNPYYRRGDEKMPFYSEAFLYPLLGKDNGRTVCYSFETLCQMVGIKE